MTSVSLPVNPKSILSTLGRWAAELRKMSFVTTKEEVIQYVVNGGPIGAPTFWLVETLPPKHIKIENQLLYVNDYKKLFAVYGYTFGSSATGDQFRLPPMPGKYPFGIDSSGTGSTLGGTFGAKDAKLPAHYHSKGTLAISSPVPTNFAGTDNCFQGATQVATAGLTGSVGATGSGNDGDAGTVALGNPPSIAGYWITRYDD